MTTFIYCLICPIDGNVKYVGKSNSPVRRTKDHMRDFRTRMGEFAKTRWMRELYVKNLKPELCVLDEVDIEEWRWMEQWWIEYFKFLGCELLNSGKGGNGLSIGNEYTFKPGNRPWNLGKKIKINERI